MANESNLPDISFDVANLYQEELFTDRTAGAIRRLTPVTPDGLRDTTRPVLFSGQTQLMTPGGVLPLGFEMEVETLAEAIAAGGSSLRDYVQPDGELGYFQHAWKVYGRENEACPTCPGPPACDGIKRVVQAGRSTFHCPRVQR